eukprot:6178087-Pleurochrysis_carterae.AAC.4
MGSVAASRYHDIHETHHSQHPRNRNRKEGRRRRQAGSLAPVARLRAARVCLEDYGFASGAG